MQRLKDESGAVAIIVAIMMTLLIGFAALAVDVSAMWAEKRQLQSGADAGALAIAQACAKGACGSTGATAQSFAVANKNDGSATGTVVTLTNSKVTVRASDPHDHWFALGQSDVAAEATVKWGGPISGSTFPLAFSVCEWKWQAGGVDGTTEQKIVLTKTSTSTCAGPSGNVVPGGFGWVDPSGSCTKASIINGWLNSNTGNTPPNGCSAADFDAVIGKTVLIPIFDDFTGTGNNASYKIYGYAAFKFTGYYFSGQYKHWTMSSKSCTGNERCVSGYFTRYVDLNEVLEVGPSPDLGLSIVTLES